MLLTHIHFSGQSQGLYFRRLEEPREKAFSLLVPDGWIIEGGALRLISDQIAGAANMIDCKFDMTVKNNSTGSVMIRWLPEMMCLDQSRAFGYPEGSVFNNTLVRRKRTPSKFIYEVAIPYSHPEAMDVNIISEKPLPGLAELFQRYIDPAMQAITNMSYQAVMLEYSYSERGIKYQERMITVIEDYGINGAGMWKNRTTMLIRAPFGELDKWEPVLSVIQNSGIWRTAWIAAEANGQRKRAGQMLLTQQEIQALDKAINENHSRTNSEINKDMYLNLTGQNEFKNPHTGETETDTNHWKYRWVNNLGEIIYSDQQNYDPNFDRELNKTGFKLSIPRK
ncbi:MAG TPA: hypothetical protein DDW27_00270 [Bacteroidales bacterium]|nr:hypothetical protein [Bacteroidales bacterium]